MELRRIAVCSDCLSALRGGGIKDTKPSRLAASIQQQRCARRGLSTQHTGQDRHARNVQSRTRHTQHRQPSRQYATTTAQQAQPSPKELKSTHARIQELTASVLNASGPPVPPEQRVLYVLEQLDAIAKGLLDVKSPNGPLSDSNPSAPKSTSSATATSALLGSVNARQHSGSVTKAALLSLTSQSAEQILRHPHIFITPAILTSYISLQTLLHQPSSFPDIFTLYASKPTPTASGQQVTFAPANPDKPNAAIPTDTANAALQAAITAHDLPLAIDIITATFSTLSFKRAKLLRRAVAPASALALAPAAAYALSTQFAALQPSLSTGSATNIAFAGIMTYVAAVSTVGYVAVTTANDQMERVTWAQGVPLWERWVREEERRAVDEVAQAWGFKERDRRGDEEGETWDGLREWVGRRGMVLDAVQLMDGME